MKVFKTWNEFLNFPGSFNEKLQIIKNSNLGIINPGTQRPL